MASAFCISFKEELLQGGHCFNQTTTFTASTTVNETYLNSISSDVNLAVGMALTGTGIPAQTVLAKFLSSQILMSALAQSTNANENITATGDAFKMALIGASPSYTWYTTGAQVTNIGTPGSGTPSASNLGTDEVGTSGTGYTSGGFALTNVQPSVPATPGTVATTSFSPNPSWTSATFSTTGAIIYNTSVRLANVGGRTCAVYDFGGTQTVTNGTLTVLMPTNDGNNAVLRIA